ncbi:MAG: uracil-DNA glycosylase family protein [Candidatus Micrarchaeaceae archaeon]
MKTETSYGFVAFRMHKGTPELLFLKRREGFLDVPKGHPNIGEDALDAAKREMLEETGLKPIRIIEGFKAVLEYKLPSRKNSIKRTILMMCEVDGRPHISMEHTGFAWLSEIKARNLKMEKFVGNCKNQIIEAFEYLERKRRMDELNSRYAKLPRMHGWKLSKNFVPGAGNLMAGVMLVGQAPGAEEDKLKRPFVGKSGRLLDRLISIAGLSRSELYITSIVQFFPPKNRLPTATEIDACLPYLKAQIEIIKPRVIVTLGAISSYSLAKVDKIAINHGIPVVFEGMTYFPSLHPAAGVRFKKNIELLEKDFRSLGKLVQRLK